MMTWRYGRRNGHQHGRTSKWESEALNFRSLTISRTHGPVPFGSQKTPYPYPGVLTPPLRMAQQGDVQFLAICLFNLHPPI